MKVNKVIEILSHFNLDADVKINLNGVEFDVVDYAWRNGNGGDDVSPLDRDIEKEKLTATAISLYVNNDIEN